jgi:steroid 5-alpha reductase family enzyme
MTSCVCWGRKGRTILTRPDRNALVALPVVVLISLGVALAGSQEGATVAGIPVFALCVGLAFVIQWLGLFALIGLMVWLLGFASEVTADAQKSRFRADPANEGRFIYTGLWAWSRHPNYSGEIVLWIGVASIALLVLQGWQWVSLISPVFVTVLLTRISGVPLLEKRADEKWGVQEGYEACKARTLVLIPWPRRSSRDE